MLLLFSRYLRYLLFQLGDKTVFSLHICLECVKLFLCLQIHLLKLIEGFFLLFELLIVLFILIHYVLAVLLNRLELFLFLE